MTRYPTLLEEHRELPVVTTDLPLTFTGTLSFGVGQRDESPLTAGISHLVEHLVMARVGQVDIAHNAVTAIDHITFFAQGDPGLVADFLNRVASAVGSLRSITDDEVARQRDLIAIELGDGDQSTGLGPLIDRYGAAGLGLVELGQPAHRTLTREQVVRFAGTWLHSGNAVLSFTGAVPDALAIDLPDAQPVPERNGDEPVRASGWLLSGGPPLSLSLILDGDPSARGLTTVAIERALHDELRTARGLVYSVGGLTSIIDDTRRHAAFVLDPREGDIQRAAVAAVETLRRLADDGPSDEDLRRLKADYARYSDDPQARQEELVDAAVAYIRGEIDERRLGPLDLDGVTSDDVAAVLRGALPTLLVSMSAPEVSADGIEALGLPSAERESDLVGRTRFELVKHLARPSIVLLSPRWFSGARGHQLLLDEHRIAVISSSAVIEVRWDELVLAGIDSQGGWDLTDRYGRGIMVAPAVWRGWSRARSVLESQVPEAIRYRIVEDAASSSAVA